MICRSEYGLGNRNEIELIDYLWFLYMSSLLSVVTGLEWTKPFILAVA